MLRVGKVFDVRPDGIYVEVPDVGGIMGPLYSFVPYESLTLGDQVFVADYSLSEENFVVASLVMAGTQVPVNSNQFTYVGVTSTYSVLPSDYVVDCTSGTFTVTLPTATDMPGRTYIVKNSGAGVITVATSLGETIDGSGSATLATQYESITVVSNGTHWLVV